MIGSDNGPAFISQVTQVVTRAIGANWKLHCAYRPQSSGQVEGNHGNWRGLGDSLIMFGRPPPIIPNLKADFLAARTISILERAPEGARGHLAAPLRHLRDRPNPNSSSAQTRRLGLRQKAPPGYPRATLEGSLHCGADDPHHSQGRRCRDLGPSGKTSSPNGASIEIKATRSSSSYGVLDLPDAGLNVCWLSWKGTVWGDAQK
ncbi:PREDICTED: uncharacterized protein LOC106725626 isoform X2 [Myotis brandtii]|uniref:uncharacterized protein LOC106725626 isoform X1 n=1 Tax=Myotis brandtii TaxID=109478 RepID=UPI000703C798|nr:PREDICTED: uncharacterized protein LOC106725626 isoform X1 [Myotis brandtii]XP_014392902.1 PREDICTED: uncharacterized protein LOC106725626 isoform X2 [Myotis brandtii]